MGEVSSEPCNGGSRKNDRAAFKSRVSVVRQYTVTAKGAAAAAPAPISSLPCEPHQTERKRKQRERERESIYQSPSLNQENQ